ncbi:hypothetical protein M413DRAFT_255842 [Hebeloma cylindrosporum]|uniref:Uncharacterized protein n=1 Tax=Hebeloma cylindrosporum TaxID=76867 RepID=A0A0C3C0I5_HEBCY|nr:hypothetical protein M413DRAFT_255842 [Hebeloma cylindrosporum h7]
MIPTIDPKTIGKPARARRHVRSLTGKSNPPEPWLDLDIGSPGYLPEKDASGKEKWPLGDEKGVILTLKYGDGGNVLFS